jgi:hypothetical protein
MSRLSRFRGPLHETGGHSVGQPIVIFMDFHIFLLK